MLTYEYDVLAFRQQSDSPIQVAFVAPAEEILKWSGVPRKSDELLTGFQRFRDGKRINQEIVPYFQNPKNCSPTAIIVALRETSGIGGCNLSEDDVAPGTIAPAKLTITLDDSALDTHRVFEAAQLFVDERVAASSPDIFTDDDEDDEGSEEVEGDDGVESESEEEPFVHLGEVTLSKMKEHLDDPSNWSNEKFHQAMTDFVKPAMLIDGQHRVSAAARFGESGLPFMVCGLYNPPWEEQVFQFTVVNLKPKRIPPSLITSIAALSLSRDEHDRVEKRLDQAGVKMREVSIMSLVAYDDASPFAERINMAVGDPKQSQDLLGYGSAKRIANVWYRATRISLTQIARQLFDTNNTSNARREWREQRAWFEFFNSLWSAVRDHYKERLWAKSPENRLFVGAHLWALQETILLAADGQMASHWRIAEPDLPYEDRLVLLKERLIEVVTTVIAYIPSEIWTVEWAKASQDTTQGRSDLVELFKKFVDKGKTGTVWKGWRNDEWFRKKD